MTPPPEAWLLLAVLGLLSGVIGIAALIYKPNAEGRESLKDWTHKQFRQHLEAHNEPYRLDYTMGDVEVPFYLPKREIAIVLTAPAFGEAQSNAPSDVRVELLAAEQANNFLYRFTRTTTGTRSIDQDRLEVETAFETLGIEPTTNTEEIEAAFREQAKNQHPDNGGSTEAFNRLNDARDAAIAYAER